MQHSVQYIKQDLEAVCMSQSTYLNISAKIYTQTQGGSTFEICGCLDDII